VNLFEFNKDRTVVYLFFVCDKKIGFLQSAVVDVAKGCVFVPILRSKDGTRSDYTISISSSLFDRTILLFSKCVYVDNVSSFINAVSALNVYKLYLIAKRGLDTLENNKKLISNFKGSSEAPFWPISFNFAKSRYLSNIEFYYKSLVLVNKQLEEFDFSRMLTYPFTDYADFHNMLMSVLDGARSVVESSQESLPFLSKSGLSVGKNEDLVLLRGVSSCCFGEVPKVLRDKKLYANEEDSLLSEFQLKFPKAFIGLNPFDCLAEAQHYSIPTRLLDITSNPLVSLYMACTEEYSLGSASHFGEVVAYFPKKDKDHSQARYATDFDSIALACLSKLSSKEKARIWLCLSYFRNQNLSKSDCQSLLAGQVKIEDVIKIKDKKEISLVDDGKKAYVSLISKIKAFDPSFSEELFDPFDLDRCYFVKPKMINERLSAQSGSFILFGLEQQYIHEKVDSSRSSERLFRIIIKNKESILEQLNQLSINESTLTPDMDHVSHFIKEFFK
jgi:hypothetical protein